MIDIQISEKKFWENEVEGYVFLLKESWQESEEIKKIEKEYYPNLKQVLQKHKFEGKVDGKMIEAEVDLMELYVVVKKN